MITIFLIAISAVHASHFDDIQAIENFKWDHVAFKTKKDCALDSYPDVSFINNLTRVR